MRPFLWESGGWGAPLPPPGAGATRTTRTQEERRAMFLIRPPPQTMFPHTHTPLGSALSSEFFSSCLLLSPDCLSREEAKPPTPTPGVLDHHPRPRRSAKGLSSLWEEGGAFCSRAESPSPGVSVCLSSCPCLTPPPILLRNSPLPPPPPPPPPRAVCVGAVCTAVGRVWTPRPPFLGSKLWRQLPPPPRARPAPPASVFLCLFAAQRKP